MTLRLDDELAAGRVALLGRGGRVHIVATSGRYRVVRTIFPGWSFCGKLHESQAGTAKTRAEFNANACGGCAARFAEAEPYEDASAPQTQSAAS